MVAQLPGQQPWWPWAMGVTALVAPLTCRSLFRPGLRAAVGVGSVRVNRGFTRSLTAVS